MASRRQSPPSSKTRQSTQRSQTSAERDRGPADHPPRRPGPELPPVVAASSPHPAVLDFVAGLVTRLTPAAPTLLLAPRLDAAALRLLIEPDRLHALAGDRARAQARRERERANTADQKANGDARRRAAESERKASQRYKKAVASFSRAAERAESETERLRQRDAAEDAAKKDRAAREAAKDDHVKAGEHYDQAAEPGLAGDQYDAAAEMAETLLD